MSIFQVFSSIIIHLKKSSKNRYIWQFWVGFSMILINILIKLVSNIIKSTSTQLIEDKRSIINRINRNRVSYLQFPVTFYYLFLYVTYYFFYFIYDRCILFFGWKNHIPLFSFVLNFNKIGSEKTERKKIIERKRYSE